MQPTLDGLGLEPGEQPLVVRAAHQVLSGRREATRVDLLLSTLTEVLAAGPQALAEVRDAVQRTWPGTDVTGDEVQAALAIGARAPASLFLSTEGLDGPVWRLDEAGRAEFEQTRMWSAEVRDRFRDELTDRAAREFRPCSAAEAETWAARLTTALSSGMSEAEQAFLGQVIYEADSIHPKAFDRAAVLTTLGAGDAGVSEFLSAAALAALDPADPFGSELVSVLATSYVLHGYLGRQDVTQQQQRLGPLQGQEVVLDTPILLGLCSRADVREPLFQMLSAALSAGVRVVVLQHYVDELLELLSSRRPYAEIDEPLLADPEKRAAYVALAFGDDVVVAFAGIRDDGVVTSWGDYEKYVSGLPGRLAELGADVRVAGNRDLDLVRDAHAALTETLAETGKGRSSAAIERDAQTIAFCVRHRRKSRTHHDSPVWPGCFVVTHDRRLSPSCAKLDRDPFNFPLVVSPAALTLLLARVRPVPEVGDLAAAAGRMLTRELAERVALRYPPAVAAELADALAGNHTDVRIAQFDSVHDVIESATASDVAAEVLRRRIHRSQATTSHSTVLRDKERSATADRQKRELAEQAALAGRLKATEDQRDAVAAELEQARAAAAGRISSQDARQLSRRAAVRAGGTVLNVAIAAALVATGSYAYGLVVAVVCFLGWWQTREWSRSLAVSLKSAWVGLVADVVGLTIAAYPLVKWVAGS